MPPLVPRPKRRRTLLIFPPLHATPSPPPNPFSPITPLTSQFNSISTTISVLTSPRCNVNTTVFSIIPFPPSTLLLFLDFTYLRCIPKDRCRRPWFRCRLGPELSSWDRKAWSEDMNIRVFVCSGRESRVLAVWKGGNTWTTTTLGRTLGQGGHD